MLSILLSILGYLLSALVFVLDKYILKSRIPSPAVYAFFVGVFSLFALGAAPFGLGFFGWEITTLSLLSGVLFVWGLVALYNAIRISEITRVAPLVGAMTPAVILLFFWCECLLGYESLGGSELIAIVCLIAGGITLSIRLPFRSSVFFRGFRYSILASVLLAFFTMIFKTASGEQNFASVFVWSRLGMTLGAFSLLLYTPFRREILSMCCRWGTKGRRKRQWGTALVFVVNKVLGGAGYFLLSLAITMGSAVVVQSLASIQYAFVIVLGAIASVLLPKIFHTRIPARFALQMAVALALITAGTILIAISGGKVL